MRTAAADATKATNATQSGRNEGQGGSNPRRKGNFKSKKKRALKRGKMRSRADRADTVEQAITTTHEKTLPAAQEHALQSVSVCA